MAEENNAVLAINGDYYGQDKVAMSFETVWYTETREVTEKIW